MGSPTYLTFSPKFHKFPPLPKLIWILNVTFLTLTLNDPVYLLILLISIALLFSLFKALQEWIKLLRPGLALCIAIIAINVVVNALIAPVGARGLESLAFGGAMSLRLLTMLSAFQFWNLSSHPDDAVQLFSKLRLPYPLILIFTISMRFMPILMKDLKRIEEAQKCRGLEVEKGNLMEKVKKRIPILLPLISNSLERALRMAEALESKGFLVKSKRTYLKELTFHESDFFLITFAFVSLGLGLAIKALNFELIDFFPLSINPSFHNWLSLLGFAISCFIIPLYIKVGIR